MKKVVIIGGGISGLTAGVYLLQNGFNVEIYEKNANLGGFVTTWKRKNTLIDGCLHWLIGTNPNSQTYKIWKNIHALKDGDIVSTNSFYKVEYKGETLTFYNDVDLLEKELYRVSQNDDEEIARLIDAIRFLSIAEIDTILPPELCEAKRPSLEFLRKTRRYLSMTVEQYADCFNSPIIKFAIKNSLIDKKFAAIYFVNTISNLCNKNADLPKGGSKQIIENVVSYFNELGGKEYLNSPVKKILIENEHAYGILLENNNVISCDYVIAACDVHHTFTSLLPKNECFEIYDELDKNKEAYPTYSFVIATYRTKKDLSNYEVARVISSDNYNVLGETYDALSFRHFGYDDSLKSNGYTTIEAFVPTYEKQFDLLKDMSTEEYLDFKKEIGKLLYEKVKHEYNLLDDELELIDVSTPLTYERYLNSYKGSFMTYPLGVKSKVMIHSNAVESYDNVFLANQWLMLPGGTPIAATKGKFCAQMILAKENKNYNIG